MGQLARLGPFESREPGPFEIILSPRVEPSRELYRRIEDLDVRGILPDSSLMQGDYSSVDAKRRQMEDFAEPSC